MAPPSPAEVEATKRALDARAARVPAAVVTWGVDPAAGVVVIGVAGERTAEVERFVTGLDPRTFRVDVDVERPRLYTDDRFPSSADG